MFIFLLISFPLYLYMTICSSLEVRVKLVRVVRYFSFGVLAYIPVYLFSRIIPAPNFFPWDIFRVFIAELFQSREAYYRILAALILICVILWRYHRRSDEYNNAKNRTNPKAVSSPETFRSTVVHADELLCWLCGYFFAENFRDILLMGPFPTSQDLFFSPLSRILFAQFLAFALEFLQAIRYPEAAIRAKSIKGFISYVVSAFVLLSAFSSVAVILNAYWQTGLILLILLLLYFFYAYQFDAIGRKYRNFLR